MTRSLRQYAVLSGICFALLTAPTANEAFAQAPPEAIKNYEKAKQAYGNGDFELAVDYLQKAYAEDPDLIYQYNRIRALQAMKSYDEALEVIDLFRGPMSRDPDQRFTDLEELEAQIREEQAQFKAAQQDQDRTDPGNTTTTDGKDPDKIVTPPPVVEETDPYKKRRFLGWTLAGAGAATFLGTSPFWSNILLKQDPCYVPGSSDCKLSVKDGQTLRERQLEFDEKRKRHLLISGVGLGVGTALLIPGIILIIKSPKTDGAAEASSTLRLQPVFGQDQAGALVTFQF